MLKLLPRQDSLTQSSLQQAGELPWRLLPVPKYMLSLRCWALLHYPGLTNIEDHLALLVADKI